MGYDDKLTFSSMYLCILVNPKISKNLPYSRLCIRTFIIIYSEKGRIYTVANGYISQGVLTEWNLSEVYVTSISCKVLHKYKWGVYLLIFGKKGRYSNIGEDAYILLY